MAHCLRLLLDWALAVRMLFCPANFRHLARFLRARHAVRLDFVAGRRPPLPPELGLPLTFDLPRAVALPRVLSRLFARSALFCWLVVCLLVVPSLVRAARLFLQRGR